jgi:predicted PurR-regulated permease PerM
MTTKTATFGDTTRWVLIATVVLAVLFSLWQIRGILLLALLSIILVIMFLIPVSFLVRRGIPRSWSIGISLASILLILTLLTIVALPTLVEQFTVLATQNIPQGAERLITAWQSGELVAQYPFLENVRPLVDDFFNQTSLQEIGGQIANFVGQVGEQVQTLFSGVANVVFSLLIVLFLTGYLLASPETYLEGMIKLFPLWYRQRARAILNRMGFMLRKWLEATLLSMVFVGIVTWIGLVLVGLEQAAALGVLAGLFSFIPNFGPLMALVPAFAVALVQAPQNIGWIILIIYGTSFLQSQIVSPLLVAESLNLPPVLVLLGQIVAGLFFGFMGIMLAVPLIAIVMVLVQEVYIHDILGDYPKDQSATENNTLMPDGL